jgi:DNA topoisomerase-1
LRVITKRGYVTGSGGRGPLIPETRGRLVSSFLSHFFSEYVDYGFTAELENALDDVANGEKKWKDALSSFWGPFQGDVENLKGVRTSLVVDVLDATLGAHFFGDDETLFENRMRAIEETAKKSSSDDDPNAPYPEVRFDPETLPEKRKCPSCDDGRLGLKLSRAGGFIGCSNYPTCRHARTLAANHAANDGVHAGGMKFPAELGRDPATGRRVSVRDGPYGAYLELEVEPVSPEAEAAARAAREMRDAVELARLEQDAAREAEEMHARAAAAAAANGEKPPRKKKPAKVKLPKRKKNDESLVQKPRRFGLRNLDVPPEDVTLDLALDLLAYPLTLGVHPEDGAPVVMNAGPFGWYVSHAGANASLSRKILRESREEAARRGGGDAGSGDVDGASETVDAEDAKSWSNVGRTDRSSGGGDDAFSFVDDSVDAEDWTETASSVSANGDVSAAAFEAAALRASFAPVSLETALAVLTRKRSKPAREGTGRWGRGAKKDGDGDARPGAEAGTASPGKTKKKVKTAAKTKKTKGVSRVSAKSNAKRAPSSYMLYCAEARGSLPEGLKVTEQAKLLGAAWKALDDSERSRFEKAAVAAKEAAAAA